MSSPVRTRYILLPVWDRLLRALHWWMVLALLIQFITGASFIIWGKEMSDALMGEIDVVHFCGGYAFAAGLALRIVWLFVGPPTAHWRDLLPLKPEQSRIWHDTLRWYLDGFRHPISPHRGHNAFAGPAYIAFFCLASAQIALGITLSLMADSKAMKSPLMTIHKVGFFLLLTFAVIHIAAVVAHEITERRGLISAMVHGHKGFTEAEYQALQQDVDGEINVLNADEAKQILPS